MKLIVSVGVNDNYENVGEQRLCQRLQAVLDHGTAREAIETGMNASVSLEVEGVAPCPITSKNVFIDRKNFMEILEHFVRALELPGCHIEQLAPTYFRACRALHHKPQISIVVSGAGPCAHSDGR